MATPTRTLEQRIVRPQAGPQERFLASPADIVLYGGGAGGGKTFALLLEPLRHISNPGFGAVCFRRESKQVTAEGGLWDTAMSIYEGMGIKTNQTAMSITWPQASRLTFSHLQLENDKYNWQGSQIPLLLFDELTHFTRGQFQYLLGRNRSTCGVRPYVRCTTNPDPDSWVRELVDWWIGPDGFPLPERDGVLRWFTVEQGEWVWGDTAEEVAKATGRPASEVLSFTFIRALIEDNPALLKADPGYLAKLAALEPHEQERLRKGNWNARPKGKIYERGMFANVLDAVPADITRMARGWDFAATEDGEGSDPDYTASIKIGRRSNGRWIVLDMTERRMAADGVEAALLANANADTRRTAISIPQDPGAAGKVVSGHYVRLLAGFDVTASPETGNKLERGKPFLAQARAGNVDLLAGEWNRRFLNTMESFGTKAHDDVPDACHRAFNHLSAEARPMLSFI